MYCSSCGTAVMPGLSYCNHCGAKLRGATDNSIAKSSEPRPEMLVVAMVFSLVGGLGMIIGLLKMLKSVFNEPDNLGLIIFFTLISFLLLLAVEGVFIWKLLSRKKGVKEAGDTGRLEEQKELGEATVRALPEPALSVTEHTTRALEAVDLKHEME